MNSYFLANFVDGLLAKKFNDITDKEKNDLLEIILNEEYIKTYFFSKLKDEDWFLWLKTNSLFDPSENKSPQKIADGFQILEWKALSYIEFVSKKSRNYDRDIIEIILNISNYKSDKGKPIDNYRTWFSFIKILCNIPLRNVPLKMFTDIIPIWFDSSFDAILQGSEVVNKLLPKYLEQINNKNSRGKVEELLKLVFILKKEKLNKGLFGETFKFKTLMSDHWLEEQFVKKDLSKLVSEKCGLNPILHLSNQIKDAFKIKYKKEDYSYVWIESLVSDPKRSVHEGEYFFAILLRKILLEKAKHNPTEARKIILSFLSNKYPHYLFKRLAILLVGKYWDEYKDIFDTLIVTNDKFFNNSAAYYSELSYLLRTNVKKLSKDQLLKIDLIIKSGPNFKNNKKINEDRIIYWKMKWYECFESISLFSDSYKETKERLKKANKKQKEKINRTPIAWKIEDFLIKTNKETVAYLNGYKQNDNSAYQQFGEIYETFKQSIISNPNKYSDNLLSFATANYHTISTLIDGFKSIVENGKEINWENILKFVNLVVKKNNFFNQKDNIYSNWCISSIAYLIREGCKSDGKNFSSDLDEIAESIISEIIETIPKSKSQCQSESFTKSLNSPEGRIITSLVYMGLKEARSKDKQQPVKWNKSLSDSFDLVLNKNICEAYAIFGYYLPNLHWVDKKWVINRINLFEKKTIVNNFLQSFMDGYLFSNNIYQETYALVHDLYEKSLDIEFKDSRINERLIQHIAVGYLRGSEKLRSSSLVDKLMEKQDSHKIREFIEYLWHQRDFILDDPKTNTYKKEAENFKRKIVEFWDYVLTYYYKKELSSDDREALSELSKFVVYEEQIDEITFNRLKKSAPFVMSGYDSPFFIEYLNNLKDKHGTNPIYIAKLFLLMLEGARKGFLPDYDWAHIREIIDDLYKKSKDNKELLNATNEICDIYFKNENYDLKEIFNNNNNELLKR